MERREHYDPEDIEQLLMERGFDELLDEERAYVLRHLSGREEYEAMRSLLMTVHRTEPDHDLLEPEEAVRDRVMAVFREQHRPGWRVWLNSVGAAILPRDASAMWRPALALGAIALLIGATLWVMRPSPVMEVAERQRTKQDGGAAQKEEPAGPPATVNAPGTVEVAPQPMEGAASPPAVSNEDATVASAENDAANAMTEDLADGTAGPPVAPAAAVDLSDDEAETVARSGEATKAWADTVPGHKFVAVTNSGYMNNYSLANAKGAVTLEAAKAKEEHARAKRDAERDQDAGKAVPDDRVLALLRAAW